MRIPKILFATLTSVSVASAAVVWNASGNNGSVLEATSGASWYPFYDEGVSTMENLSNASTANGKLVLLADAATKTGYAGAGLNWNTSGTASSISSYSGVCITYRSAKKFRINIVSPYGSDNHYGYVVAPASEYTETYIPFSDMTQESGWGTTFTLSSGLAASTGIQIMAKGSYYSSSNNFTNAVEVLEVGLGDVCGTSLTPAKGTAVTETGLIFDAFNNLPATAVNTLGGTFSTYSSNTSNTVAPASGAMDSYLTTNNAVGFSATLSGTGYPAVGISMTWGSDLADLSSHDSLCVVYKSSAALRMNLKQSSMEYNSNYYGATLAASTKWVAKKAPFNSLVQESDWGYATPLDLTRQLALLFEYKSTAGNSVSAQIAQIGFGNSCSTPSSAPITQAPYNSTTYQIEMEDGATLKIALSDILQDPYDDSLLFEIGDPSSTILTTEVINDTLYLHSKVNVSGTATVEVLATDTDNEIGDATLTIHVTDVDHPPVAVDDAYTVAEDNSLTVTAAKGVLANDYSQDSLAFIISTSTEAKHGTIALNEDGSFTYTPAANYFGKDTATYIIKDSRDNTSNTAKIIITVTGVNDAPTITADNITVTESYDEDFPNFKTLTIDFADLAFEDVDGETLNYGAIGNGIQASLISTPNTASATGWKLQLKSVKDFNGTATVIIFAYDAAKDTASTSFEITINPVADAVIAVNDSYKAYEDSVLTVTAKDGILANDTNPDPSEVTKITLVTEPKNGTLKIASDGSFTYAQSEENWNGMDTATYTVTTKNGLTSSEAMLIINVQPVNDAPKLDSAFDTLFVDEDFSSQTIALAAHFSDIEGDSIIYGATSLDSNVTVSLIRSTLYIRKVLNFNGIAKIRIAAWNKTSDTTYTEMIVSIAPVNDKPVASILIDTVAFKKGSDTLKVALSNRIQDPDGDTLTFEITSNRLDSNQTWITGDTLYIYAETAASGIYRLILRGMDPDSLYATSTLYIDVSGTNGIAKSINKPLTSWKAALANTKNPIELYSLNGKLILKLQTGISPIDLEQKTEAYNIPLLLKIDNHSWMFKK